MDFDAEKLFPMHIRDTLKRTGLHKIAGAMLDIDEVTIKEAAAIIGAKAYLHRRENQKIAAGLKALSDLTGEKLAGNPMMDLGATLLRRAAPAALGGMALTTVPKLLSGDPITTNDLLAPAAIGGLGGLIGGMGATGYRALKTHPELLPGLTHALNTVA
jgi:hypothetical protein